MELGAIILAAGASTRLGSPKQLLPYAGDVLIRRAASAALAALCRPVIAVLGAGAEQVRASLAALDVQLAINSAWQGGMGTSIRLGIATLQAAAPEVDGVLLMVCDQPLIDRGQLSLLIAAFRERPTGKTIAAAKYAATIGVPAIFAQDHFPALLALPDDAGAKPILLAHRAAVSEVEMPAAAIDIDTPEQFEALSR